MLEVYLRASGLAELFDCPRRFYAKNILKRRSPGSTRTHLGTSIHAATALHDQSVLDGAPVSLDDARDCFVQELHHPKEEVDWSDGLPRQVEGIGLSLVQTYIQRVAPQFQYSAVEMTLQPLAIVVDGVQLTLTGTTDRIEISEDGYGIGDLKTGAAITDAAGQVKLGTYSIQLGVYELLAEHTLGQSINAPAHIIGLNTKTGAYGVGTVTGARDLLVGTEEQDGVLVFAAKLLKEGLFYGNPSSRLCSKRYCPEWDFCPFHH